MNGDEFYEENMVNANDKPKVEEDEEKKRNRGPKTHVAGENAAAATRRCRVSCVAAVSKLIAQGYALSRVICAETLEAAAGNLSSVKSRKLPSSKYRGEKKVFDAIKNFFCRSF